MHTNICGNTCRQKCCAKGSGKEVKIQEFMYRDTTNVEPEMYDYTGNNWSHWNSNEKLKETFESCTGKTFDKSPQKTAILGTSHIIRKVLQCEAWSVSGGDHRWFKRSTRKKRPVTRDIHIYNNNNAHGQQYCYITLKCDPRIAGWRISYKRREKYTHIAARSPGLSHHIPSNEKKIRYFGR